MAIAGRVHNRVRAINPFEKLGDLVPIILDSITVLRDDNAEHVAALIINTGNTVLPVANMVTHWSEVGITSVNDGVK